jgi:hypothetical protein
VESVAVTLTVKPPLTVGVPEIIPAELMDRPDGKPVALQLIGVFPPAEATGALYTRLIAPLGKDVVVTDSPGTMVNDNGLVTV